VNGPPGRAEAYNEAMKGKSRIYSYTVFYEAAPEGGYVATVPALSGCHSQGENLEEAEHNIREAIEVYIESLAAHGEPVPEETRSFHGTVKIPVSLPA
jgi:predicted RNase H-like HicB family nuclease